MENMPSLTQQILIFLLGAATLHGLYLSVLIFFKNQNSRANQFLAMAIFSISLFLLNYLFFLTNIISSFPHLLSVLSGMMFLVGPGFYFFVKYSLQPDFKWQPIHWLHYLPLIYIYGKSISIFTLTAEQKLSIINMFLEPEGHFNWSDILWGNLSMYFLFGYVVTAFCFCFQLEKEETDAEKLKSIRLLKKFCLGFGVLILIDFVLKIGAFALELPAFTLEYLLAGLIAIAVHSIGYFVISPIQFFQKKSPQPSKYKTSALDANQIETHKKRLQEFLEKEKPWLQPNLKIADLAAMQNIPSHQLSQILSEGMETNFSDLINQYRIEEIKRRLVHPDFCHYSILAIALDCGFSNKATFNRVFKKTTGTTPSKFVNK